MFSRDLTLARFDADLFAAMQRKPSVRKTTSS